MSRCLARLLITRLGFLGRVCGLLVNGHDSTNTEDASHYSQGHSNWPLEAKADIRDELECNEEQNNANGVVHVRKIRDKLNDQGIKRPETQDRTHARSPDNDCVLCDAKDGWNRIDREDNVRELNNHEHKQQRGAFPFMHEIGAMVAGLDWNQFGCKHHTHVVREVLVVIVILSNDKNLVSREDEHHRANQKERAEGMDHRRAGEDHQTAEHDGTEDTPEEHTVLGGFGVHLEVFEDEVEGEEIVERERHFDHVPGVELHHGLVGLVVTDPYRYADREAHPQQAVEKGLASLVRVGRGLLDLAI